MMQTRFIITWIPAEKVREIADKHKAEIDNGASVWDFCQPEDLEQTEDRKTARGALSAARSVLPLDEFGEVHILEQIKIQQSDELGSWTEWTSTRSGVVTDTISPLALVSV